MRFIWTARAKTEQGFKTRTVRVRRSISRNFSTEWSRRAGRPRAASLALLGSSGLSA